MARSWSWPLRRPDYSSFNAQPSVDGGGDTLIGGQRVQGNYLIGDAQQMSINARGGNDTLISGTAGFFNTPLIGEASLVSGSVRCGNDTLIGGPSNTRWRSGLPHQFHRPRSDRARYVRVRPTQRQRYDRGFSPVRSPQDRREPVRGHQDVSNDVHHRRHQHEDCMRRQQFADLERDR